MFVVVSINQREDFLLFLNLRGTKTVENLQFVTLSALFEKIIIFIDIVVKTIAGSHAANKEIYQPLF